MNWKIEVYSPAGVLKTSYTPSSPGGIVNSIRFSVEPSGNCLDGSFEGIPNQLNINPRDIIYIYPDNTTSYYAGYVKTAPNKNSSKIGTYTLEGLKKLVFDYLIDEFWVRSEDGKPVLTGLFTTFNSTSRLRIVRLLDNGSVDTSFVYSSGFTSAVNNGADLYDSSFLLSPGSSVTTYNGTSVGYLAKVSDDGSLDTIAQSQIGTGPNSLVHDIKQTEEGKFYIAGAFTTYNGTAINRVARVYRTGALDTTFSPSNGADATMYTAIPILSSNKCIFCGDFTTFNGTSYGGKIVRVFEDGSIDGSFNPGTGFSSRPEDGIEDDNGKVVLTGTFSQFNSVTVNGIVRLNTSGSRDTSFNSGGSGFGSATGGLSIKRDYRGRYVIGGNFTSYNGQTHNRIIRLNPDGSVDTTFNNSTGAFNSIVRDIELYPDGRILAVGDFLTYKGATARRVARLLEDGSLDKTFSPTTGPNANVYKAYIQRDPSGIVKHSSLVASLYNYLPPFIRDLRNGASLTSGNRGPVVASGYSLGSILDAIVASSQDDTYEWGVDGTGTLFVQKKSSSTRNFDSVSTKQVTLNPENDDEIVTKVKFVFSVPAEYTGLSGHTQQRLSEVGRNIHYRQSEFTNTFPQEIEYNDSQAITYTYQESDSILDEYGEFTKVVPLALSETWTVLDTMDSGNRLPQSNTRSNATFLRDQDGGTASSPPISVFGDGTYLTNNLVISTDTIFSFYTYSGNQGLGTTQPNANFSDQDTVIGMQIRFDLIGTDRKLKFQLGTYYTKALESESIFSSLVRYEPSPDSTINYANKTVRLLMSKAPLTQFVNFNPLQLNRAGLKNNDIRRLDLWLISSKQMNGYSGAFTDIGINSLKIYEVFVIKLNKELLDSFGSTLIKLPSNLSSSIRTFSLPTQNYQRATLTVNSISYTTDIVRVNYNISNADGFYVDYVTGYDDQRSNEFIKRIAARDTLAQNNSFLNSSGRSVL